jgi:hypothetical protein
MLPSLITRQLVNGAVTNGPLMWLHPRLLLVVTGLLLKLQLLAAMDGIKLGHLLLRKVLLLPLWLLLAGTQQRNPLRKAGSKARTLLRDRLCS